MLQKRTLIIIASLVILLGGGFLVYYYFFRGEAPSPQTQTTIPSTGQPTSDSRIKAISQEPALGVTVDGQKIKYYLESSGNVLESDPDGSNPILISSVVLPDLLRVSWSLSRNKVIAVFDQDGKEKKYSYDYLTKVSTPLNDNIGWTTWSPEGDRIAYQYYNSQTGENKISLANSDGSNWTTVLETKMKNLIVEWPKSDRISIRTRPSGLAQSIVQTIDPATGKLEEIIGQTYGLSALWSPLGNKLLFSETDKQGKNLKLKTLDLGDGATKEVNLVTLPEKCVWSQDNRTIFCAVPKDIPSSSVLPDDFYKKTVSFSDEFYRVNLDSGVKTQILKTTKQEATINAEQLLLTPQEDYLIFINQKDGQLYSLKL